jgi:hypothetical protein
MPVLRNVFIGVVGVLAVLALVAFWSSWSVDEVSTFRTAFHGGVTPPPKFACNTHFAADAGKDTIDWRCDALNAICRRGFQSACERVATYKPFIENFAPVSPASSVVPNPAFEKSLSRLTQKPNGGGPLTIQRRVYGGNVDDIPHISPDQLERDRNGDTSRAAKPNSAAGNVP